MTLTFALRNPLAKDYVFGATMDGTKIFYDLSNRRAKNETITFQVDFTWELLIKHCCYYHTSETKWLLIDFGTPKTFNYVTITAVRFANSFYFLKSGTIWYGNTQPSSGEFNDFKFFGSYPDFTKSGQSVEVKSSHKVTAQFVGIKQKGGITFYVCHIEVY